MNRKNGFTRINFAKQNLCGFTLISLLSLRKRSCKGFTLIELLVVISILAILSSIAMVIYNGVTAKARDDQRIKDLLTIKQALELYRSDAHNYPASFVFGGNLTNIDGLITYLSPIPQDVDSTNRNYYYLALPSTPACDNASKDTTCTNFILCAKKEGTSSTYDLSDCSNTSLVPLASCRGDCDIGISSQ